MPPTECVKVILRVRPLNQTELGRGNYSIIECDRPNSQLSIIEPSTRNPRSFAFDAVYPPDCTQQSIYDESAFPLVESVIEGYNGTIFAYGQTGCGKTYTMLGGKGQDEQGIIPNSFGHIFGAINEADESLQFLVRCSYCEIYNEELRDLLHSNPDKKLVLKEHKDRGIFVDGLSWDTVRNIRDIERAMDNGTKHRVTKGTDMNATSSRSHAIFTICIEASETKDGQQHFRAGKLNLVDLAGSERQKKTHAEGDRLKEAIQINQSLSSLGNVISALVDGNVKHIPYRDSKLTRLLQDSLGGNTKTVMCAVASPADYNYDESLSTLRYASRAKFIQNKPTINEDPKDALLRQYADEIARLKKLLEGQGGVMEPIIVEKIVEKFIEVPVNQKEDQYGGAPRPSENVERKSKRKIQVEDEQRRRRKRRNERVEDEYDDDFEDDQAKPRRRQDDGVRKKNQQRQDADQYDNANEGNEQDNRQRRRRRQKGQTLDIDEENGQRKRRQNLQENNEFEEGNNQQKGNRRRKQAGELRLNQKRQTHNALETDSDDDSEEYVSKQLPKSDSKVSVGQRRIKGAHNQENRRNRNTQIEELQDEPHLAGKPGVALPNSRSIKALKEQSPGLPKRKKPRGQNKAQEQLDIFDDYSQQEQNERERLESILADLQNKLINGNEAVDQAQKEKLKQQRAYRQRLKKQKQQEQQLREEAAKKEEEMLMKDQQYQNLEQEVEQQRKIVRKLRQKLKQSTAEVKDSEHEHIIEKEELLENIRSKDRDLELFRIIFAKILDDQEFQKIKYKSVYDDDNHTWKVPQFVIQSRQTQFPKLPATQVREIADRDKQARKVIFSSPDPGELEDQLRNVRFDKRQYQLDSDDDTANDVNTYPQSIEHNINTPSRRTKLGINVNPGDRVNYGNSNHSVGGVLRKKSSRGYRPMQKNVNRAVLEPLQHNKYRQ